MYMDLLWYVWPDRTAGNIHNGVDGKLDALIKMWLREWCDEWHLVTTWSYSCWNPALDIQVQYREIVIIAVQELSIKIWILSSRSLHQLSFAFLEVPSCHALGLKRLRVLALYKDDLRFKSCWIKCDPSSDRLVDGSWSASQMSVSLPCLQV